MEKTIAVLGGDRRMALLARLLAEDGHPVRTWGLAAFGMEDTALEEAAQADRVVLPVPLSRGKNLNCTAAALPLCGLFALLRPEQTVGEVRVRVGLIPSERPEEIVLLNTQMVRWVLAGQELGMDDHCGFAASAARRLLGDGQYAVVLVDESDGARRMIDAGMDIALSRDGLTVERREGAKEAGT